MASGVRANPTCCTNEDCPVCELCGSTEELKICARCKEVWYCSKEHQKRHWKQHKKRCCVVQGAEVEGDPEGRVSSAVGGGLNGAHSQISVSDCDSARTNPNISNGSEHLEAIEGSATSHEMSDLDESVSKLQLDPGSEGVNGKSNMNTPKEHVRSDIRPKQSNAKSKGKKRSSRRQEPTMTEQKAVGSAEESKTKSLGDYVVKCLNDYGLCVVDNFLGEEICGKILDEVKTMQDKGIMCDGELVSKQTTVKKVRGDKIAWTEKGDPGREYLSVLIQKLDNLIMSCSQRFGRCVIGGRTKASIVMDMSNLNRLVPDRRSRIRGSVTNIIKPVLSGHYGLIQRRENQRQEEF